MNGSDPGKLRQWRVLLLLPRYNIGSVFSWVREPGALPVTVSPLSTRRLALLSNLSATLVSVE